MLYWHANFQIPMSGVQSADVYAIVKEDLSGVNFYSDSDLQNFIFEKAFSIPKNIANPEEYLLTLDYFQLYRQI